MSTYTIGETSERSGFSASSLRYYEGIGLVEPASRTDSGYRLYDDGSLARLAFIARAKQLGCTLDEVADLVEIWDGQRCGPVQRRFHDLVSGKIRGASAQIAELSEFATQLQAAAEKLNAEPVDGPCDADCACLSTSPAEPAPMSAVTLGDKPVAVAVPIACTLDPGSLPDRLADWQAVFAAAQGRFALDDGGLRIEFAATVDLGELARLIAAEQHCCAFFSFALTVDERGTALEVRAPHGAAEIVADLFGRPA